MYWIKFIPKPRAEEETMVIESGDSIAKEEQKKVLEALLGSASFSFQ